MAILTDAVAVPGRVIKVTIIGPADEVAKYEKGSEAVQQLGQRAWNAPGGKLVVGKITVRAEKFRR